MVGEGGEMRHGCLGRVGRGRDGLADDRREPHSSASGPSKKATLPIETDYRKERRAHLSRGGG